MSLFSGLRRRPATKGFAESVGSMVVQFSAHECSTLQNAWQRTLDDKTGVALFAELAIIYIAVVDRLAFDRWGDPDRSRITNSIVDTVRSFFANQQHFGDSREERGRYFEQLLARRFPKFAECSTIMGREENQLVLTGAIHLVEAFLNDLPEEERSQAVFETGKALTKSVTALTCTQLFRSVF